MTGKPDWLACRVVSEGRLKSGPPCTTSAHVQSTVHLRYCKPLLPRVARQVWLYGRHGHAGRRSACPMQYM